MKFLLCLAAVELRVLYVVVAEHVHQLAGGGAVLGKLLAERLAQAVQCVIRRDACGRRPPLHSHSERLGPERLAPSCQHHKCAFLKIWDRIQHVAQVRVDRKRLRFAPATSFL